MLYALNAQLTKDDEREIEASLPDVSSIPNANQIDRWFQALSFVEPDELARFWDLPPASIDPAAVARFRDAVSSAALDLGNMTGWQRAVVAAGHAGGQERELWRRLADQVGEAHNEWQCTRALLVDYPVDRADGLPREQMQLIVKEIREHVSVGGALGFFRLRVLNPKWRYVVEGCRVDGSPPSRAEHFEAIWAHLRLVDSRQRLQARWKRQAESVGLPPVADLADSPEMIFQEYAQQFQPLLDWWPTRWRVIEAEAQRAGFRWEEFRAAHVARSGPTLPFDRDASLLSSSLLNAVVARWMAVDRVLALRRLGDLNKSLEKFQGGISVALRRSLGARDKSSYQTALEELKRVTAQHTLWTQRRHFLGRLGRSAKAWADAIRTRQGLHGLPELPGDPQLAWKWRQFKQEVDRRASLDEEALTRKLHQRRAELRAATADLIDRRAWLAQLCRTDLPARQALQGWADTVKKIGKGTGRRAPELQARARKLLAEASNAVPVWIMPLARVAESIDPLKTRFDVVIVDEASQSDVTGLLAWYLGERIAVVGDHEQVSPMAVGQEIDATRALIAEHLEGIPNNHLYDGATSIYHLARQCFGGTLPLREHFRCVPDIIEFSNALSYNFEIRPLRSPMTAERPHVVEFLVDPALNPQRDGKTNVAEARIIAALLKATTDLPDRAHKTIGAISLLGDEQAHLISALAIEFVGAVDLERHRFVAGNSAQFQGDERDIMFLSMVDVPGAGPLRLTQTDATKQRYNVAASRAMDQLWLIHSLDPNKDLKPEDLRRRLIEYVRDPGAKRRELDRAGRRAESPFEKAVMERLIAAGYKIEPQVQVGGYRIDIVVSEGPRQVALECDGDRFHGSDRISEDMARQAVLERAGWQFIRLRGTRFYRDPEAAMAWTFGELARLGVRPACIETQDVDVAAMAFRDEVTRRAWDIMRAKGWLPVLPASREEITTTLQF